MMKRTQVLKKPRIAVDVYCCYPHRVCMQPRVEGYEYCLSHILEDKASPYKQCAYISSKTGKRCPYAAPKADRKEGYCLDHSKRAAALRQRAVQVKRPAETPETLLDELDHYQVTDQPADPVGSKTTKPGTDTPASRLLDYASSSDSDDQMLVDQAWAGDQDSDAESIDSDQEDPLKHAGVYTAEEVAWITRDKLIRLQSLYIDQFKRLQHLLKEKRRKYLHAVQQKKDSDGTLESAKEDPEQRIKYDTLMALRRYHKRHGKEALLHRQSRERRIAMSEGPNYKAPSYPKCAHSDETTKCTARTLPLAKYCYKHILRDPSQSLYQACGFADGACCEPIAKLPGASPCLLHRNLPEITARLPKPEPTLLDASHIDVVSTESGQDHLYSQAQLSQLPDQIMAEPDPEPMEEDGENKAEKTASTTETAQKEVEGKTSPEDAKGTTSPKVEEGKLPPESKEDKKPEVTCVESTVDKQENVSAPKEPVQEIKANKPSASENEESPPKTEQESADKMEGSGLSEPTEKQTPL